MGAAAEPAQPRSAQSEGGLEFRVLGPLEVLGEGKVLHISGHRRRVVLLMLLLEPGRLITVDRLIRAVWDGAPPKTAETQVQICVSQLRNLLATVSDEDLIRTRSAGYLIRVPDDTIDMVRFRRLVVSGRAAIARGDAALADAQLRAALDLWRGELATDVHSQVVQAAALRLNEERLAVLQDWIGQELELGRHHERIAELTELAAAYPLREKLHAQLALALYRAGRQAEALAACRRARDVLLEEHGIDPGEELRWLERGVLENDPGLDLASAHAPEPVVPRQLPAPPSVFVGRAQLEAELRSYLAPGRLGDDRGGVLVVSISGAAGVGKSALAVQVAHQVREAFPDGQLYAHLRGTDALPVPPEHVLNQFLRSLGVAPATLPSELGELAALYRSRLAGRRVLVVLDDAAREGQVRPLVPGEPQSTVLITSRHGLPGLAGAHRVNLEALDPGSSLALLRQVLGESRVHAEPAAAAALADACGHLPLALQVAAARLSVKSHWRLAQMTSRLSDERRRLDELTIDDVGVRPSISISYRMLTPRAGRLLKLLAVHGATDFAGWVAAPLLGVDLAEAGDSLDELVEGGLVEVRTGSGHRARHRLHDLTRIFARERLAEEVSAAERVEAQHRLLRCWLFLACQAHRREHGGDNTILHSDEPHWTLPPEVVDELLAGPMQWFQNEHANLVAAVSLAAQLRLDNVCWDLAVTSVALFETRAYYDSWRETHEVALVAIRRAGNARGEAVLRYSRGGLALAELRLEDAQSDLEPALAWFAKAGDRHGHGLTLRDLASIDRMRGRYDEALARYETALADLRLAGDRVGEAHVLRNIAQINLEQGLTEEAEARLRAALALCAKAGVRRIEAQVRYRLGQVLLATGELAKAEDEFRAVLAAAKGGNDVIGRANALLGLGNVHLARDELGRAETVLSETLVAARDGGSRLTEAQTLLATAELLHRRGESGAAATTLDSADALFSEIGSPTWQARVEEQRRRVAGALEAAGASRARSARRSASYADSVPPGSHGPNR